MELKSLELPSLRQANIEAAAEHPPHHQEQATGRRRYRNTSPDEEFARRVQLHTTPEGESPLEAVPDGLIGLLLEGDLRTVKLGRNGICFEHQGQKYQYWHQNSVTIKAHDIGSKVSYHWDEFDPYAVHVFDRGRYIESIPMKNSPGWFTSEAREEMEQHRRYIDEQHKQLQRIHGKTTREKLDRTRDNAEALQAVTELRLPKDHPLPQEQPARMPAAESGAQAISRSREYFTTEQKRRHRLENPAADLDQEDPFAEDIRALNQQPASHSQPRYDADAIEEEEIEDELDISQLSPTRTPRID